MGFHCVWGIVRVVGIRRGMVSWEEGGMYHSDGTVPGAGAECILRHQVPVHGVDLSHVLFPGLNGELIDADVEELDGAIAGGD